MKWHRITNHFHWKEWEIRTANTQHEVANRSICINADGQRFFYSGDGRPTAMTKEIMVGADLAFQECASNTPLPDDASHGDFYACQKLIDDTQISALGLYHCFDESMEELSNLINPVQGLFLSQDGLTIDLSDKNQLESLAACQK